MRLVIVAVLAAAAALFWAGVVIGIQVCDFSLVLCQVFA